MDPLEVPSETLLQLADALEAGHVRGPFSKFGLRVRMFFDITVGDADMRGPRTLEAYEARFAQIFRNRHWCGARLPEVFHDPRTIDDVRISLHAKCIVIDDEIALVTSANTSVVAQEENIEAGVLIEDRLFALALGKQFDDLVTARQLVPVRGLSTPG